MRGRAGNGGKCGSGFGGNNGKCGKEQGEKNVWPRPAGGERMHWDATYVLQERLQMAPACWRLCPLCGVSSSGAVLIKSVAKASCQGSCTYSIKTYGVFFNSRHLRLVSRGGGEMSQGRQVYMRVCCAKLKASSASLQVAIVFFGRVFCDPKGGHTSLHPLRRTTTVTTL